MKTNYSHAIRMLICGHCGAPLSVPPTGGNVSCAYCSTVSEVGGRNEEAQIAAAKAKQPLNEPMRYQQLRAQDGKPLMPPASLHHYLVGGGLPAQMVPQAMQEWTATRAEVQAVGSFPVHERLYFLTLLLDGAFAKMNEEVKRRALLETALEVLTAARHKQVLRGMLGRQAVREGDLHAAEAWLAPCDPYSDDIHMDTAYRFSCAYLETARRNWPGVLHHVGPREGDVPIADGSDHVCGMLRANAHEKQGQLALAVEQLTQLAQGPGLKTLQAIQAVNSELQLCPNGLAQVASARASAAAPGGGGRLVSPLGCFFTLFPVGFVIAGILSPEGAATDDGFPLKYFWFFMAACFAIGPVILLAIRISGKRRRARFAQVGIDGTAKIVSVSETGVRVNNQPQVAIRMTVYAGNMPPYEVMHKQVVSVVDLVQLQPGASIQVKVDPSNPRNIML